MNVMYLFSSLEYYSGHAYIVHSLVFGFIEVLISHAVVYGLTYSVHSFVLTPLVGLTLLVEGRGSSRPPL